MKNVLTVMPVIFITVFFSVLITTPILAGNQTAEVTEHLGSKLPLDLKFTNSEGEMVLLKDLVKKPTVIDFVYYRCAGICTPLMVEVADVIEKADYDPGEDYEIISISIDRNETPKMAAEKKRAMIGLSGQQIPDSSWAFLTGDSTSIYTLTNAAGFGFTRTEGAILHKGVLIITDKTGKIVQYLNPGYVQESGAFQILPSEFNMAIRKAARGELTPTVAKILQTCFNFIPHDRTVMILLLLFFSSIAIIISVIIISKRAKIPKAHKST